MPGPARRCDCRRTSLCRTWRIRQPAARPVDGAPPDVAHAHFWMSGVATVLAAQEAGVPPVRTFRPPGAVKRLRQGDVGPSPPDRKRCERMAGKPVGRVIATCSDEVFELARQGCRGSGSRWCRAGSTWTGSAPHGPVAPSVPVGRLVPRKGSDLAIAAFRTGAGDRVGARGRIGFRGASPESGLGVAGRVRLAGQVCRDDLPALLRPADAVLCTPWHEPFGTVPLEAVADGGRRLDGHGGGRDHRQVGAAARPGPAGGAVAGFAGRPAELEALGTAEQKRIWARCSWDRIAAGDRAGRLCRRGSPDGRRGDAGRRRARAAPSPESRTRVNRVPPRTAPSSTAMAPESLRAAKSPSRPSAVGTMNSSRLVSGTENPALPRTS
nr:glycosyltransferase [Amycolatopsis rubida]